jgi:hypothetical protein
MTTHQGFFCDDRDDGMILAFICVSSCSIPAILANFAIDRLTQSPTPILNSSVAETLGDLGEELG